MRHYSSEAFTAETLSGIRSNISCKLLLRWQGQGIMIYVPMLYVLTSTFGTLDYAQNYFKMVTEGKGKRIAKGKMYNMYISIFNHEI